MNLKKFFGLAIVVTIVLISTVSCFDPTVRLLKAIHTQFVDEGSTLELDLMAYVFPVYSAEAITFEIDSEVGEIIGTKFVYSPDFDSAGVYSVELTANSNELTDNRVFAVTVVDKNRAPSIDVPDQHVEIEEELRLDLTDFSDDLDEDALAFSLISGVGEIMGNTYMFSSSDIYVGENSVTVGVSDGKGGTDSTSFSITVFDSNGAPQINLPDQTIEEGENLSVDLLDFATDPDGDALTFELINGVGSVQGSIYEYSADYESAGVYGTTIGVTDTKGASSSDQFQITVENVNRKPEVPTNQSPTDGETDVATGSSLKWTCSDPDGDALQYDIYLGKDQDPLLVAADIFVDNFVPGDLDPDTEYYWKVVASDGEETVESPVWKFTTVVPPVILTIESERELIVYPKVSVNNQEFDIPVSYVSGINQTNVVEVDTLQVFDLRKPDGDDVRLNFIGWSDGENAWSREILMDCSKSLSANFAASYYLNIATSARYEEEIPGEGWHVEGTSVAVTAPKIEGYTFRSWDLNETYGIVCGEVIVVDMDGPVNLVANYTHDCP
ncbi:Ig-like domain-containing protein [Mesotoga sp.]|uniref:Ig-like domain-containing protein n=2 Tax=Mesotoga sp. TaxID=2053577 RepID=UPI00262354F8|nr:Ig-like domain-containing protein [Mesotoga sp.]MDD4206757.1 PKD domain-containing protein [Mesotoga sp.]